MPSPGNRRCRRNRCRSPSRSWCRGTSRPDPPRATCRGLGVSSNNHRWGRPCHRYGQPQRRIKNSRRKFRRLCCCCSTFLGRAIGSSVAFVDVHDIGGVTLVPFRSHQRTIDVVIHVLAHKASVTVTKRQRSRTRDESSRARAIRIGRGHIGLNDIPTLQRPLTKRSGLLDELGTALNQLNPTRCFAVSV